MRYKYNLEEPKIIYLLVFVTNIKPVLMKCKRCKEYKYSLGRDMERDVLVLMRCIYF